MKYIDKFLNSITMYKLVLYGLFFLALYAVAFEGPKILIQLFVLFFVCYGVNITLSKIFKMPMNAESSSITALILFFLIAPYASWWIFVLAGVIAMISKYVLVYKKKHIFNPAITAAFILWLFGVADFTWWVGSAYMLVPVMILGLLVVRKLRRFYLFLSFLVVAVLFNYNDISSLFLSWPLIFFGTIMLTEPLSTPPTHRLQIVYGALVGALFSFGPVPALVVGNIFSFIVSPKQLLVLRLKEKKEIAENIWEFIFSSTEKLKFIAGQYAEWTLPHNPDSRGNRRYFTIASAPNEDDIRIGIRVNKDGSSYKNALLAMQSNDIITVSQISGDFVLPKDKNKKLAFIAGGIGVTPFRSIIASLVDPRDIVLFYLAANPKAFAYKDILEKVKTIYADKLTPDQLAEYKDRTFYISGPNMMVDMYKKMLKELGVKEIITDYFPGY